MAQIGRLSEVYKKGPVTEMTLYWVRRIKLDYCASAWLRVQKCSIQAKM